MDEAEIKRIIEAQGKSMSNAIKELIKDSKKSNISESEIKRVNQALKEEVKSRKLSVNLLVFSSAVISLCDTCA